MPLLLHVVTAAAVDGTSRTTISASSAATVFDMTRVSRPTTNVVWRGTRLPGTVRSGGVPPVQRFPPIPRAGYDRLRRTTESPGWCGGRGSLVELRPAPADLAPRRDEVGQRGEARAQSHARDQHARRAVEPAADGQRYAAARVVLDSDDVAAGMQRDADAEPLGGEGVVQLGEGHARQVAAGAADLTPGSVEPRAVGGDPVGGVWPLCAAQRDPSRADLVLQPVLEPVLLVRAGPRARA